MLTNLLNFDIEGFEGVTTSSANISKFIWHGIHQLFYVWIRKKIKCTTQNHDDLDLSIICFDKESNIYGFLDVQVKNRITKRSSDQINFSKLFVGDPIPHVKVFLDLGTEQEKTSLISDSIFFEGIDFKCVNQHRGLKDILHLLLSTGANPYINHGIERIWRLSETNWRFV